jgi:hypothetical protein
MLCATCVAGAAPALPSRSAAQVAVLALAEVPGLLGFAGIPIWRLRVDRDLLSRVPTMAGEGSR